MEDWSFIVTLVHWCKCRMKWWMELLQQHSVPTFPHEAKCPNIPRLNDADITCHWQIWSLHYPSHWDVSSLHRESLFYFSHHMACAATMKGGNDAMQAPAGLSFLRKRYCQREKNCFCKRFMYIFWGHCRNRRLHKHVVILWDSITSPLFRTQPILNHQSSPGHLSQKERN